MTDAIVGPTERLEGLEAALLDRVARALRRTVVRAPRIRRAVRDPNAHRAYLEGRYRLARLTADDTLAAIAAFERALALDATDAPAHAGLAIASAQMYIRFGSQADVDMWKTRAERHAAAALAIDPRRAEPHEALAAVARYTEFDWDRVVEQSYAAVQLNPGLDLPHYYVAAALQHVGRFDLVEDEIVAGLEANPWNLSEAYRLRGVTALWSGRFADARTELERVRQLAARPVSDPHLAAALYYGGDAVAAEAMLDGLTGSAQAEQRATALLASIVAARGDRPRARALAARVESRAYHDHHVDYSLGATYAGLGDVPAAIRWLRQASSSGFLAYPWYQQDPLLKPLQATPEFEALLAETKTIGDRAIVLGCAIDRLDMSQTLARCEAIIEQGAFAQQVSINATKLVALRRDGHLREVVSECELVSADGQSVVWASRLLGDPLPERVPGIDLMHALIEMAEREGWGVYILGARPRCLRRPSRGLAKRILGCV